MIKDKYENGNNKLVIFIHGLIGSDKTWGEENPLYDLLYSNEIIKRNYDIATYEYYSEIKSKNTFIDLLKGTTEKNLSIKQLAGIFRTKLMTEKDKYQQIVLIGHSMGGLIGKEHIIHGDHNIDLYISIATPHHGSTFAKFLKGHEQAKNLEIDNEYLSNLNRLWVSSENVPKSYYIYGEYDDFVPEESAIPKNISNRVNCIPVDKNHINIVKPVDAQDSMYKVLNKILCDFVDEVNFEKIILNNFSKMQLDSQDIIDDLRSHSYSLKNAIELEQLKSIFNYTNSSMDLLSKDSLKTFVNQYSQYLYKYSPKIKEVAFVGISLIPLSVLEGFILRNSTKKRYFVNYNQGEIGYRELNDTKTPKITFSYKSFGDITESVCIKVKSSFPMEDSSIKAIYPDFDIVEISANTVTRDSITSYYEILQFQGEFRKLLNELNTKGVKQVHLFIGAPVCINIACGEVLQTHDPNVIVYNYLNRKYDWGLNLTNNDIIKL